MSLRALCDQVESSGVPRASGDEPADFAARTASEIVFPARAGMSRIALVRELYGIRVPRASGDEPNMPGGSSYGMMCSPRERG